MDEERLVSIIMPAYNSEKYISESIRSVLAQTYKDWELIIVDDGSQDRTANIVREFSNMDARIKYFYQQNEGQGKARNAGINRSRGELIAFLDSDDLWLDEKLEVQVKVIRETNADLVYTDGFIFNEDNITDETLTFSKLCGENYGLFDGRTVSCNLIGGNYIPVLSVIARRGVLEAVGYFEEDRRYQNCEDYDLWLKLGKSGAVFYGMKEKLVRYRRHASAMTYSDIKLLYAQIALLEKHAQEHEDLRERAMERAKSLYRLLISELTAEGRTKEAAACLRKLASRHRRDLITYLQSILINICPYKFNQISDRLYRAENRFKRWMPDH